MEVITVTFLNEVTTVDVHTNDVLTLRKFDCFERIQKLDRDYSNWQILVVYIISKKFPEDPAENSREQQIV